MLDRLPLEILTLILEHIYMPDSPGKYDQKYIDAAGYHFLSSSNDMANPQDLLALSQTCKYLRSAVHSTVFKSVSCWSRRNRIPMHVLLEEYLHIDPNLREYGNSFQVPNSKSLPSPQLNIRVRPYYIPPMALKYVRNLHFEKYAHHGRSYSWLSNNLQNMPCLEELSLSLFEKGGKKNIAKLISCILKHKPKLIIHLRLHLQFDVLRDVLEHIEAFESVWSHWTELNIETLNLVTERSPNPWDFPPGFFSAVTRLVTLKEFSLLDLNAGKCYRRAGPKFESPALVLQVLDCFKNLPKLEKIRLDTFSVLSSLAILDWSPNPRVEVLRVPSYMLKSNRAFEIFDQVTHLEIEDDRVTGPVTPAFRNLETLAFLRFDPLHLKDVAHFVSLNPNLVNLIFVDCCLVGEHGTQLSELFGKIERLECHFFLGGLRLKDIIAHAPKLCSLIYEINGSEEKLIDLPWLLRALVANTVSPNLKKIYSYANIYSKTWSMVDWVRNKLQKYFPEEQLKRIVVGVVPQEFLHEVHSNCAIIDLEYLLYCCTLETISTELKELLLS